MAWTVFCDLHSGGRPKLAWTEIFVEGDGPAATEVFKRQLGRDPAHVTCACCGADYNIDTRDSLAAAAASYAAVYGRGKSPEQYLASPTVLVLARGATLTGDALSKAHRGEVSP